MRGTRIALLALLAAFPVIAGQAACSFNRRDVAAETTFTYTVPAEVVDSVGVTTAAGHVTVVGDASRDDISIEAHVIARAGSREKAERLMNAAPIIWRLVDQERRLIVQCVPEDYFHGEVEVNFTLHVPPRLRVAATTVHGTVSVSDVRAAKGTALNGQVALSRVGSADGATVNGPIRIEECTGSVRARAVKGSVECFLAGEGSPIEVETLSGSVDIALPDGWSPVLDVKTLGALDTSHFNERQDRSSPGRGPLVRVRSLRGPVTVRSL